LVLKSRAILTCSLALVDSILEFAAKGVEQEAAHVLALLGAAGNALTTLFLQQLLQPQVDSDEGSSFMV